MLVLIAPSQAQAHGLHASASQQSIGDQTSPPRIEAVDIQRESSQTGCISCCSSSSCFAVAPIEYAATAEADFPEIAIAFPADLPIGDAAQRGLRRPPKHIS